MLVCPIPLPRWCSNSILFVCLACFVCAMHFAVRAVHAYELLKSKIVVQTICLGDQQLLTAK